MLTSKQTTKLKSIAMTMDANYQIGKNELSETLVEMLDKALTAKELIKISILKTAVATPNELAIDLSSLLKAEVVQVIGRVIVLYRRNHKTPVINLG